MTREQMRYRDAEFERLRRVLAAAEEPLTAREVLRALEEADDTDERADASLDSPHRVATILGRRAEAGDVEVIAGSPYRYRLPD
jgi:hypothetical protein